MDQAIWGERKAAELRPPVEEVGEGGLALFWPAARAVDLQPSWGL